MQPNLEEQAENLAQSIRHYLITSLGRQPGQAYPWEIFQAVSLSLREAIMVNWTATVRNLSEMKARRLYFLSMEYLPGRMLVNTISNLGVHPLMKKVMEKLGYNYNETLLLEPDPGLGNGGLGRLASCFLDSLATQQYPATAYGLRYQYGTFEQQIWEGIQIEKPDCWLLNENPWGLRRDGSAKIVKFAGLIKKRLNGRDEIILDLHDYEEVRALPFDFPVVGYSLTPDFSVVTLRLWSTKESPHNFHLQRYNAGQIGPAAENTALTDVLYPNDNHETGKRIRLKQEFLLVSASLQDIIERHLTNFEDLSTFADHVRIQINDTHPALVIAELIRLLTKRFNFKWQDAFETTQEVVGFTNHTILSEALETWNRDRLAGLLPRQYRVIEQINHQLCQYVRNKYPADEEKVRRLSIIEGGQIRMAHLAIYGSHRVNGVARLHGEILKKTTFKDFYELFPEKFTHITNGISQRHWLWHCNPLLADFLTERIGNDWLKDFSHIQFIREFASDLASQKAFLEVKAENKRRLIRYLYANNPLRDLFGRITQVHSVEIDRNSLFAVQAKRVHEYKRQLMNALHLIMVYFDLLENPHARPVKRTAIISGKAAAGYLVAKHSVQLFYCIARTINHDPKIEDKLKIIFIENYCVTKAEEIIPAAELSEQISTAGKEASGTGNMKLAINGALTIGTDDGANIEMREAITDTWWPFSFGARAEELERLHKNDSYNPWDIYSTNPKIKRAIDSLKDGTFTKNASEDEALSLLFDALMLGFKAERPDPYFVVYDLQDYYDTQLKVEAHYQDHNRWAETAIHNIAGMGGFSADVSIDKYAKQIWELKKLPLDPTILLEVKKIYDKSTLKRVPKK
jgi:glycogen phosphorylase